MSEANTIDILGDDQTAIKIIDNSISEFIDDTAYIFSVNNAGAITMTALNSGIGIRPVISIDASITASGTGTIDDPYVLDLE